MLFSLHFSDSAQELHKDINLAEHNRSTITWAVMWL